jgi:hypothetical protein
MADGILRCEVREIACREAGEPNAELCVYLVRLHPNTTQRRVPLCLDVLERANLRAHAEGGSHDSSPFISRVSGYRSLATHLRSIQSLAGRQRARGRLDVGGVVASMFLRLRTIVLLVLASLPVNAANVTGVIITKETASSPAVNVAAVYQIQTRNRSDSIDLGSVGGLQNQTEKSLPLRIKRNVGSVVGKEVQMYASSIWLLQGRKVRIPTIRAN